MCVIQRHKRAWWYPGTLNKSSDLLTEEGEGLLHPAVKTNQCTPELILPVCTGAHLGGSGLPRVTWETRKGLYSNKKVPNEPSAHKLLRWPWSRERVGFVTVRYPLHVAAAVVLPFQCNLKKINLYTIVGTSTSQRFLLLFSFFIHLWLQINEITWDWSQWQLLICKQQQARKSW